MNECDAGHHPQARSADYEAWLQRDELGISEEGSSIPPH